MNPVSPLDENIEPAGDEQVLQDAGDENGSDADAEILRAMEEADHRDGEKFEASREAVAPKHSRRPDQPTQKEIDEHRRASHIPYQSWCKHCVEGRGLHDQHKSSEERNKLAKSIPCVSMDYVFMEDSQTATNWNPILATYDHASDSIQVYVTRRKGVELWLPRAVSSELETLGYGGCRVNLKNDQENAVMDVKRSLAAEQFSPTSMFESPVRESQSNGKMEKAIQKWHRKRAWGQYQCQVQCVRLVMPLVGSVNLSVHGWIRRQDSNGTSRRDAVHQNHSGIRRADLIQEIQQEPQA